MTTLRPAPRTLRLSLLLTVVLLLTGLPLAATAAKYAAAPEDYAPYQPQKKCRGTAQPGTTELARWINRKFAGGTAVASVRSCRSGGASEHKDGRAIDWAMNAKKKKHRVEVRQFLRKLKGADGQGNKHALARRMGVMYIIWNDHMYASYDRFKKRDYLNGSCPKVRSCSATLRHRDHVHISLSKRGARGATSWQAARL